MLQIQLKKVNLIILYYSMGASFNIYHFNSKIGVNKKIIDRTYIIERFSNNDFVVTKNGIYFMDRKNKTKRYLTSTRDNEFNNLLINNH